MAKIKVEGVIIPNDYKWFYQNWLEEDSTCPNDVESAIANANGDLLEVEINSPGGEVSAGSDIYTMLREYGNIKIQITGQACSAASVIAMAGPSEMSPTALLMVHCASSCAYGDHNEMDRAAEMLTAADRAICAAYVTKSGMSEDEALAMMESTTWLTAEDAVKRGLVDEIMFEDESTPMVASRFRLPTQEEMDAAMAELKARDTNTKAAAKSHYLKLKGEMKYDS